MKRRVLAHLALMEVLYVVEALLFSMFTRPTHPESLEYIRHAGPLTAFLHIWLNNAASALLLSSLGVVHPVLAYLGMIPVAASDGRVLASWLSGYVPNRHLVYSVIESQGLLLSSLLGINLFLKLRGVKGLLERWDVFRRHVLLIAVTVTLVFLVLAAVETWEVLL